MFHYRLSVPEEELIFYFNFLQLEVSWDEFGKLSKREVEVFCAVAKVSMMEKFALKSMWYEHPQRKGGFSS